MFNFFLRKYIILILSNVDHFFVFCFFLKFRLSLKIEPGTSTPRSAASREDLVG